MRPSIVLKPWATRTRRLSLMRTKFHAAKRALDELAEGLPEPAPERPMRCICGAPSRHLTTPPAVRPRTSQWAAKCAEEGWLPELLCHPCAYTKLKQIAKDTGQEEGLLNELDIVLWKLKRKEPTPCPQP